MPRGAGNTDQVLQSGRLAYGDDGTNFRVIRIDSSGHIIVGAGTANIGDVDVLATKTVETELLTAQTVAASTWVASSVLTLTSVKHASIFVDHGRTSSAAFGTRGTQYLLQVSQKASGNDTWRNKGAYTCASTACLAVAASADVAVGGTTVVVTSGTSIPTRGDIIFWANTVSAASSEWLRARAITGTASFTIVDGLTYAQDSDTNIFTEAEHIVFQIDAQPDVRARVLINNNNSGTTQTVYARVAAITEK